MSASSNGERHQLRIRPSSCRDHHELPTSRVAYVIGTEYATRPKSCCQSVAPSRVSIAYST